MLNVYNLTKLVNWRYQIWGNKGIQVGSKDAKRVQSGHMVTTHLKSKTQWLNVICSLHTKRKSMKEPEARLSQEVTRGYLTHTNMNQRVTWLTNLIRIHNKLNIQSQQAGNRRWKENAGFAKRQNLINPYDTSSN